MNIAMQARARYSFALASTVDPGTAGTLCNAVGTQTAQALSTMIEGSMAWPSITQSVSMVLAGGRMHMWKQAVCLQQRFSPTALQQAKQLIPGVDLVA